MSSVELLGESIMCFDVHFLFVFLSGRSIDILQAMKFSIYRLSRVVRSPAGRQATRVH